MIEFENNVSHLSLILIYKNGDKTASQINLLNLNLEEDKSYTAVILCILCLNFDEDKS